jgi:hypothetical protein
VSNELRPQSVPPKVDPQALAVLNGAELRLAAIKSITAKRTVIQDGAGGLRLDTVTSSIALDRSGKARVELEWREPWTGEDENGFIVHRTFQLWDGRTSLLVTESNYPIKANPRMVWHERRAAKNRPFHMDPGPLAGFFAGKDWRPLSIARWHSSRVGAWGLLSLQLVGEETWEGNPYNVVEWVYKYAMTYAEDTLIYTTRLYVGRDSLIHRIVTASNRWYTQDDAIRDIRASKCPCNL